MSFGQCARYELLVAVAAVGFACGSEGPIEEGFIAEYARVVGKVGDVCASRRRAKTDALTSGKQLPAAADAAFALVIGRAVSDYQLPDAPKALAECRAEAVAALDSLEASLGPLVAKAGEPQSPTQNAELTGLWQEARSSVEAQLRQLGTNWDRCLSMANAAKLPTAALALSPFATGC